MVLFLLTFVFIAIHASPGDPAEVLLGPLATEERLQEVHHELGIDRPLIVQYFVYISSVFRGNFGVSMITKEPVIKLIGTFLPATIELAFFGFIIAVIIGIGVGTLATRNSFLDLISHTYGILIYAVPVFWSGIMFQLIFGLYLRWLPAAGRIGVIPPEHITKFYIIDSLITGNWAALTDCLRHLILPSVTMGLFISGLFVRIVRVNLLEALQKDYVRMARAKGLRESVVLFKHAFKNALNPVVTIMGLQLAALLGGSVLTETTFAWPGLGRFLAMSVGNRDYTAVQGIVAFFAIFVGLASLLIDVINAYIDPRIKY